MLESTKQFLLTIPETAHLMRVSRSTVYRLIDQGVLDVVMVRSSIRIRPTDVERYLDAQQRRQHEKAVRFA